jgi:hypothetical protein
MGLIIRDLNHDGYNLSTTQLIRRRQGSHGPLQTRPSIQAQSKRPHHRQKLIKHLIYHYSLVQISFIKYFTTQFHLYTFLKNKYINKLILTKIYLITIFKNIIYYKRYLFKFVLNIILIKTPIVEIGSR